MLEVKGQQKIPSEKVDVVYSISTLEYIGQKESGFVCSFTPDPPKEQEELRNAFCEDLFRIFKPGGYSVHLIDHAVRNLT